MGVVCSISVFLLGSLPITMLLQKLLQRPFTWIGRRIGLDSVSMTGFLITCVSPLPTLALMKDMNPKGKLLNVAFMVSGASAIGAHLAFVNSVELIWWGIMGNWKNDFRRKHIWIFVSGQQNKRIMKRQRPLWSRCINCMLAGGLMYTNSRKPYCLWMNLNR